MNFIKYLEEGQEQQEGKSLIELEQDLNLAYIRNDKLQSNNLALEILEQTKDDFSIYHNLRAKAINLFCSEFNQSPVYEKLSGQINPAFTNENFTSLLTRFEKDKYLPPSMPNKVQCPECESTNLLLSNPADFYYSGTVYRSYVCRNCGMSE